MRNDHLRIVRIKKILCGSSAIRRLFAAVLAVAAVLGCCGCADVQQGKPLIGIAWRADTTAKSYLHTVLSIERAGGCPVLLDQVLCDGLNYNDKNVLQGETDPVGALSEHAAEQVKNGGWKHSNAKKVMKHISAVVFTGGEDISPSLYRQPEQWHGIFGEINYNATRDVSDYLLMTYCVDNDIPVLGICRGMQMLAVADGAGMIQDLPAWFADMGKEFDHLHRYLPGTPEGERDYVAHSVTILENSDAYEIIGAAKLNGCPSLHHQAVADLEGTGLVATGFTTTCGVEIIEIIERPRNAFVLGLQFHPEAAVGKHSENTEDADSFLKEETALSFFRALVYAAS